jgi:hypothetical protein
MKLVVFMVVTAMKASVLGIKYAIKLVGILIEKLQTKLKKKNTFAV